MSSSPTVPLAVAPSRLGGSPATIVWSLVVVELVSGLVQGIVPTVTPGLGRELGVDTASLNWINSVFLLSSALWVPVLSKLGDLYGHRKLLRVAAVLLAAGSVMVAVAPNLTVLLIGRVLQGALLTFLPLEMALVRERLSTERARSGIAILIGALTLGVSLGFVVAGALLEVMGSAQSVLWVPAIATIACIVVPFLLVPESPHRRTDVARLDWPGALLLGAGLGGVMLALTLGTARGWTSPTVAVAAIAGVGFLVAWWIIERRTAAPLVAVRLLAKPKVSALYLAALLVGMATFGPQTVLATFAATPPAAGHGLGLDGLGLGVFLCALGAAAFLASTVAARLAARVGQRAVVVVGFLLIAAAFLGLLPLGSSVAGAAVVVAVVGLGCGAVISTLPAMILERIPHSEAGISAGVYNTVRTIGGSMIAAVFAAVLTGATDTTTEAVSSGGYQTVWLVCAAVGLLGALLVAATGRLDARTTE